MNFIKILQFAIVIIAIGGCKSAIDLNKTPIGLINNVSYNDAEFNNPNASNGFLVEHENNTYAITAKHILIIAKTDKMKFVDFEGELKEWRMHPKDDLDSYVVMDKLLNSNQKDSLNWDYLGNNWDDYNDWLVFSIKENKSRHKPLGFRKAQLTEGEKLFAIGWAYVDTVGSQRVYEYIYEGTEGNYLNLKQVKGPKSLGGLSGSPIVASNGEVVGLVSTGWEDEATKEVYLQATSMKNVLEFLKQNE